ncbi:hypothetical protein ElyMa_002415600, partial [Elysia marginata]
LVSAHYSSHILIRDESHSFNVSSSVCGSDTDLRSHAHQRLYRGLHARTYE